MQYSRRGLLTGLLAFAAAPAIVKADNLMKLAPVKGLFLYSIQLNAIDDTINEVGHRIFRHRKEYWNGHAIGYSPQSVLDNIQSKEFLIQSSDDYQSRRFDSVRRVRSDASYHDRGIVNVDGRSHSVLIQRLGDPTLPSTGGFWSSPSADKEWFWTGSRTSAYLTGPRSLA